MRRLVVRWTVGDVSIHGFEALSLSTRAAFALFGADARYVVCANPVYAGEVRRRLGEIPPNLEIRKVHSEEMPSWMRPFIDPAFAEGMAWWFGSVK